MSLTTRPPTRGCSPSRQRMRRTGRSAKLAALLGPCILLSEDKHMRGLGAAGADWRPLAVASRDAMMPTQAVVAGVIPVTAVGSGVSWGVGLLRAQPALRLPAALGGLALLGALRLAAVQGQELAGAGRGIRQLHR